MINMTLPKEYYEILMGESYHTFETLSVGLFPTVCTGLTAGNECIRLHCGSWKTWQYICDHNSEKSWWILIILRTWKRRWIHSASALFTYLFYMWRKYDVTVTFMTLMSCDSVCCMCGEACSSRWLMTQLTQLTNTLSCLCSYHRWTF